MKNVYEMNGYDYKKLYSCKARLNILQHRYCSN